ncbi:MAG: biopolymer transporter ExbD [Candidatus Merdousia sp.]|nr:biopolymer transporter ExbD [Candidatus Merdousia sp.]
MKVWKPSEDDGKFEMTPMIDVVFLLITFFMTVTSYASAELVQVAMPIAPEAKVPEDVGDRQFLSVSENGTFFLGAFASDLPTIKEALMARNQREGFKGAYIRADAHTPFRYVNDLMKTCAEAGVYNILFGTLKD